MRLVLGRLLADYLQIKNLGVCVHASLYEAIPKLEERSVYGVTE